MLVAHVYSAVVSELGLQNGVICRVGTVFDGSPAGIAGLQENDNIVALGLLDGKACVRVCARVCVHPPVCMTHPPFA